jgi:hypothetical protein
MTWKTAAAIVFTALVVGAGVYWWQQAAARSYLNRERAVHQRQMRGESPQSPGARGMPAESAVLLGQAPSDDEHALRQEVCDLQEALSRQERAFSFEKGTRTTGRFLRVYYALDYDQVFYHVVPEPADSSLAGRLRFLATMLTEHRFGLPIEVARVENRAGKLIATINLKGDGWSRFFATTFQGTCTDIALRQTFLQRDYEGEWVDSVELDHSDFLP